LLSHQLRGQLNFDRIYNDHRVAAIAGGEIRSAHTDNMSSGYYGYDDETLTYATVNYLEPYRYITGATSALIPNLNNYIMDRTRRFVSLFANAAYTFRERYTFSTSFRTDASNLFGLKTNDQWNPF